ncbi:hypothetical protein [Fodinicola feengrottensis]|uniref:hypothetical protein n=1 Tax=Fodinicola feengrottensis TaxID=435914 RepID=UPI0013D601F6|nr:hypothetical protein [Fodinicola feengrottensis]
MTWPEPSATPMVLPSASVSSDRVAPLDVRAKTSSVAPVSIEADTDPPVSSSTALVPS